MGTITDKIPQMFAGVFCFCEVQPWQLGDVLQAQALLPLPPLKPWSCGSRTSRSSSSEHDPMVKSREGGQRGDTVAAHSLPCWDDLPGLTVPFLEPLGAGTCHLIVTTPQYASLIENEH